MKIPELLAPAGDIDKLVTAIHYGADAVYCGADAFSLRGRTGSFAGDTLAEAIRFARGHRVKTYVTINIFPHEQDLQPIEKHLDVLASVAPDGIIVSDPGIFMLAKKKAPRIPVHVSTQANVTNSAAAKFWQDMGAARIVLARELSFDEVRKIREAVSIELELFVHGALCISYSGRCYISSYLTGRGANRGECTNSCRWRYALVEETRPGQFYAVEEDSRGAYLMNARDLCLIDMLPDIAAAGINSVKIEGRMKGVNYVGGAVHAYRSALNAIRDGSAYDAPEYRRQLGMISGRGYTQGMLAGDDAAYNLSGTQNSVSHDFVGIVTAVHGSSATIAVKRKFKPGDMLEFLSPGMERARHLVESITGGDGTGVDRAVSGDVVSIPAPAGVRVNDLVRRERQI